MIYAETYDGTLRNLGMEYFVHKINYVPDLLVWSEQNNTDLAEPYQPMKLITQTDNSLTMLVQSNISEEMLDHVINNLALRWTLKDNRTNIYEKLNSVKKKLVFCFLKECSRTTKGIGGDELIEDTWALDSMEKLGFFNE